MIILTVKNIYYDISTNFWNVKVKFLTRAMYIILLAPHHCLFNGMRKWLFK